MQTSTNNQNDNARYIDASNDYTESDQINDNYQTILAKHRDRFESDRRAHDTICKAGKIVANILIIAAIIIASIIIIKS